MLYIVKLNADHKARPEQVTDGNYLGPTGFPAWKYSEEQALTQAAAYGGKIEPLESHTEAFPTEHSNRFKVGYTGQDDDTGKYYTSLEVDAINMPLHFQCGGKTVAESRSIAHWLGNILVKHIPNR